MKKYFNYYSSPKKDLRDAIQDCQKQLEQFLTQFSNPIPLHAVFFIPSKDNTAYSSEKEMLQKAFSHRLDHFSCIGQEPYLSTLAMEVSVVDLVSDKFSIRKSEINSTHYTVIESDTDKLLYASGLCGNLDTAVYEQSDTAFAQAQAILQEEGMDFSHVFRQWNYIEKITDFDPESQGRKQNYQIFNDVRSDYYSKSDFVNGYPAATGIGMDSGGIILDIIASKGKSTLHIPIVNPEQQDAHCYTQQVLVGEAITGKPEKTTPKFERAKYVEFHHRRTLYISGTAAIKGEITIPSDNITQQTEITLDNISKLQYADSQNYPYRHIRAYIKDPANTTVVQTLCREYFGNIPMLFLKADVCRDNLIVEIEAEVDMID